MDYRHALIGLLIVMAIVGMVMSLPDEGDTDPAKLRVRRRKAGRGGKKARGGKTRGGRSELCPALDQLEPAQMVNFTTEMNAPIGEKVRVAKAGRMKKTALKNIKVLNKINKNTLKKQKDLTDSYVDEKGDYDTNKLEKETRKKRGLKSLAKCYGFPPLPKKSKAKDVTRTDEEKLEIVVEQLNQMCRNVAVFGAHLVVIEEIDRLDNDHTKRYEELVDELMHTQGSGLMPIKQNIEKLIRQLGSQPHCDVKQGDVSLTFKRIASTSRKNLYVQGYLFTKQVPLYLNYIKGELRNMRKTLIGKRVKKSDKAMRTKQI